MRLEDMMTREYATLNANDSLEKAIHHFRNSQRDGLPVLNNDGTLVGIFTKTNLYDALLKGNSLEQPVKSYYNRNVVKISKDLTYNEVIDEVRRIPVGTGVVVDHNDAVVGLFTKVELITALFKEERLLNTRLKAMYQGMHNALVSVDEQCRINFVNRAAEQLFGFDYHQVNRKTLEKFLPGLDMRSILDEGKVEIGMKFSTGIVSTMVNKTPLIDNNRVIGALAIFQDITELESVAEEISTVKRLNQTLRTVLDIGYDALVVVDESGSIVLVNRTFLEFLKMDEQAVMQRPVNEVLENSRLHIVTRTGVPELNDIQFIDGKPYVVSRLPIVRDGQIIGAVGKISFRRVDELRELARRLETMDSRLTHFQEELKKARYQERPYCFDDIAVISPAMQTLVGEAKQAALGLSNVLISGESGVGKELMAQAIHQFSPRRDQPFIKVNCAAIPENLLESEFFGYATGAFTGARRGGKQGRIDMADGGTLFLDEIGDMPYPLQGKILRVLQDHSFERVGGTSTIHVDIRIVAATNHDLETKVKEGSFRKDLFYRLNVIPLSIPPLRDRQEDILTLVHAFLLKYNDIFGMNVKDISADALNLLKSYNWPGNIRELENVIERAMNFTGETTIQVEHLPPKLREIQTPTSIDEDREDTKEAVYTYRLKKDQLERETIIRVLQQSSGNKSEAARVLGMSRSWLYEKMNRLGLQ